MCFCFVLGSQLFFAFELIKYDFQKDEPMRNEQGWCHRVREGKTGYEDALLIKEPESTRNWCRVQERKNHGTECDIPWIVMQVDWFNCC